MKTTIIIATFLALATAVSGSVSTNNFCKRPSNFQATAKAKNGKTCTEYVGIYEKAASSIGVNITKWSTVATDGTCAKKYGGHALSVHLDDMIRSCCTDRKTACDPTTASPYGATAMKNNFCKCPSKFNPLAFAKNGKTCPQYVAIYEKASIFNIKKWSTVATDGKCAQKYGGHALSVHLNDMIRSCCTDKKTACDPGASTSCSTSSAPTSASLGMLGLAVAAAAALSSAAQ